jgi:hypothetical protein
VRGPIPPKIAAKGDTPLDAIPLCEIWIEAAELRLGVCESLAFDVSKPAAEIISRPRRRLRLLGNSSDWPQCGGGRRRGHIENEHACNPRYPEHGCPESLPYSMSLEQRDKADKRARERTNHAQDRDLSDQIHHTPARAFRQHSTVARRFQAV